MQGDTSFNQYLTELKLKAKSCEFAQLQESLIRDRVVCGNTSKTLRERLLREDDISLEKAAQLCLAAETTKVQIKQMHEEDHNAQAFARESKDIDAVRHKQTRDKEHRNKTQASMQDKSNTFYCTRCGTEHVSRKCPAYGKPCKNCKKTYPFAKKIGRAHV